MSHLAAQHPEAVAIALAASSNCGCDGKISPADNDPPCNYISLVAVINLVKMK